MQIKFGQTSPLCVAAVAAVFLTTASVSDVQARSGGDTMFGLGLQVGDPLAGTGKVIFSQKFALQFGMGFTYWFDDYFYTWVDGIWYPAVITTNKHFVLSWYFGVGGALGALTDWDGYYYDHYYHDDRRHPKDHPDGFYPGVWFRVPFGFSFFFSKVPVEAYINFGPQLQVYPPVMVYPFVGIGARWYFI